MNCPECKAENLADSQYCSQCGAHLSPLNKRTNSQTKTYFDSLDGLTSRDSFTRRYKIIENLGSGGMGTVYKVEDKDIKEVIALKLLKRDIATDKENIRRFQNELKFTRKINHKNVCRMYHLSRDKKNYFITMEYVRGEDLKSIICMIGQMSAGKAVHITKQVCEGLVEAHKLGVIHRDLKPQNIMIDKDGNARIMDFGIARSIDAKGITLSGVMIGTPEYMSPEQVEGKEIDQRSDIYSLGIVLYELLSGRVPFEGEGPLNVALKHKNEIPIEPRELNIQIPDALNKVILKCLEKDREKRYKSAENLLEELIEIEKNLPNTARIISKGKINISKRVGDILALKKRLFPAFVILINIVAIIAIIYIIIEKPSIKNRLPTFKQLTFAGNAFYPALAPDSKFFAYVEYRGYDKQDVVVQDLVNRQSLVVMNTRNSKFLRWSPDSSKLSFWADTEEHGTGTFVIPMLGGSPYLLETDATNLTWSSDGSHAAWGRTEEKKIHILDYSTENSTTHSLKGTFNFLLDLEWSPTDKFILFLTYDDESRYAIWTVTPDGKIQQKIIEEDSPIYSPRWSSHGKAIYYFKGNSNSKELWKIPISITKGNALKPSSLVLSGLYTSGYFTLSRDGKKLLCTKELKYSNLWLAKRKSYGKDQILEKKQLTSGTLLNSFPSLSPDGNKIAFSRGDGEKEDIYIMPFEGGIPQQITFLNSINTAPVWSPDGNEIAFGSNHDKIVKVWKIRTRGGKPKQFSNTRLSGNSFSLTWSPGEKILYHKCDHRNYIVLDPQTEIEALLVDNESVGWIFTPKYSPDGKKIAVHWNRNSSRGIWIISLENPSQTLIRKGKVWPIGWTADENSIYGFEYSTGEAKILKIALENNQTEILGTIFFEPAKYMHVSHHMSTNGKYFVFSILEKNSDVLMVENFDPELK